MSVRPHWHDGPVQQEFFRPAGDALAWVDELPEWSLLSPVGHVDGYWRWRGVAPDSAVKRAAAWGYRAQRGGMRECGVLGARFEPHEYPYLRVSVAATLGAESCHAPDRFLHARVGLPLEYVGAVLTGAFQEPDIVGPGTLTFNYAAVHEIDSSWEMLRLLAIGVVRLLGLPSDGRIPMNLLPNGIRLFVGQRRGFEACEVKINGRLHEPSTAALAAMNWPRTEQMSTVKVFLLLVHPADAARLGEPT